MKTLLFSNQGLSPLHFGIELEIAQRELELGNDLKVLYCQSNLQTCYFNPGHNLLACSICESRVKSFYKTLNIKPENLENLKNITTTFQLPEIKTIDDVFNIRYKGLDIGRGIAASYISTRRNYKFNPSDITYIHQMAIMCANVIENFELKISSFKPDQIIVFNGRFSEMNAVLEVCTKHKIDFYTFERSSAPKKFKYYKNALPHSIDFRSTDMTRLWESADIKNRDAIASKWFDNRLNKDAEDMKRFLAKQKTGHMPKGFDPQKENIAIFIASEDEHKAVKEHDFEEYENQNEAITTLLDHFKDDSSYHFYLRVHPHLRNLKTAQVEEIKTMSFPNLTIIHAHEEVDTYELLRSSNKILSFGSTTGIEATYHGKPSISFGHSYYQSLDCCYYPKNFIELFDLIETNKLSSKPKESTYKYSYYQAMVGEPLSSFKYIGKVGSTFNSMPIKNIHQSTVPIFLRNLNQLGQWSLMNKVIFKQPLRLGNMFKLNSHMMNDKLK